MINILEELLQDYARYSFMEGTIDENTSMHLVEDAQNYIKALGKENLLNIHVVIGTLFCDKVYNKDTCERHLNHINGCNFCDIKAK